MAKPLIIQDVARLDWATDPLPEISTREAVERLVGGGVESTSECTGRVVGQPAPPKVDLPPGVLRFVSQQGVVHPMIGAIHRAYQDHRPLVLSPDMFWLLFAQGFALHVNNNPNEFRDQFRVGQQQQTIEVRHDGLFRGSPENPWEEVFDGFCKQIANRIGEDNYAQIMTSFSTTGRVERAANAIVLMDAVKSYFKYHLRTRCGIPQVVLEGTAADWEQLRDRTQSLGKTYAVHWWTDRLLPILDRVARTAAGKEDVPLWQSIYKVIDGSGGPYVTGWIVTFLPYVGRDEPKDRNPALQPGYTTSEREPWINGLTTDQLPSPLSKVPFLWIYEDRRFPMELLAGFVGFTQEVETLRLRPKIGWAVRDAGMTSE